MYQGSALTKAELIQHVLRERNFHLIINDKFVEFRTIAAETFLKIVKNTEFKVSESYARVSHFAQKQILMSSLSTIQSHLTATKRCTCPLLPDSWLKRMNFAKYFHKTDDTACPHNDNVQS